MTRESQGLADERQPQASVVAPLAGVVGVGASAGGLEALQAFFSHLPTDGGLAFVVAQHLERRSRSVLAELIGSRTSLPVEPAADGLRLEPDHVYVLIPGTQLRLEQGLLRTEPAPEEPVPTPIDVLFSSLASEYGPRAAGVLLSGTGTDGTAGLRAIKERGGLTLAQAPETARHAGMPRSAIEAGLVQHILPAEQLPGSLAALTRRQTAPLLHSAETGPEELRAHLGAICAVLQARTGHEVARYKQATLMRRILRRMHACRVRSAAAYLTLLQADPAEAHALLAELLIGVTQFFRDPAAYAAIAAQVIPALVSPAEESTPLRVWVPGCASGEEAYSLGMLLVEEQERVGGRRPVQIFATDLDAGQLEEARQGHYPATITEHVSPARLARFFTRQRGGWQIIPSLRQMCLFSQHNLVRDPPLGNLNLISCRNVLIYFEQPLQHRLGRVFHHALRTGGYLWLGPSEALPTPAELFETLDPTNRIFRRRTLGAGQSEGAETVRSVQPLAFPRAPQPEVPGPPWAGPVAGTARRGSPIAEAFERLMLQDYVAPGLIVTELGEIVYVAGPVSRHLHPPPGPPTTQLLDQVHGRLRIELRSALQAAVTSGRAVVRPAIPAEVEGQSRQLGLVVRPLLGPEPVAGLFAVIFDDRVERPPGGLPGADQAAATAADEEEPALLRLEGELRSTQAELRATVEELEESNEALRSANEALRSTNEELQTSEEELRSLNEELRVVNTELQLKVEQLATAHGDLQNLFASTEIATLFLDRQLRLGRFTPAAAALLHLRDSDVGRPLADLAGRLGQVDLVALATEALAGGRPADRQTRAAEGEAWYVIRTLPYRSPSEEIAGVVVTVVDVSLVRRTEEALRRHGELLRLAQDAMFAWRLDGGGIELWNRGAEELYGYSASEALGSLPQKLLRTEWSVAWPEILAALRGHERWTGEFEHRTADGRRLTVVARLQLVTGDDGVERVLESTRDVTERRKMVQALRDADQRKTEFLAVLSHELRNPLAPIRNGLFLLDRVPPDSEQARRAKATIDRQVAHLTRLVDDLLDVTRIERGRIELQREPLDLGELVRCAVQDAHSLFAQRGVALELDVIPGPLLCLADRTRLAQVLGNLLQNAAKFTKQGGWTRVQVETNPGDAREAVLRVQDNGIGIAADVIPLLFEPVSQADRTLDRSLGGLGLGLALVRRLVELHGGRVQVSSAGPGQGSEFTVILPLLRAGAAPAEAAPPAATPAPPAAAPAPPAAAPAPPAAEAAPPAAEAAPPGRAEPEAGPAAGQRRRVLIIEDNTDGAQSLRAALELIGHQVAVAYDGPEGLDAARRLRPEVVICDIGLPGMDGYEVARQLRADPQLAGLRLVALSGYAQEEDVVRSREAGFDAHVAKPPNLEQLEQALQGPPAPTPR